jgi:hypothetical protein
MEQYTLNRALAHSSWQRWCMLLGSSLVISVANGKGLVIGCLLALHNARASSYRSDRSFACIRYPITESSTRQIFYQQFGRWLGFNLMHIRCTYRIVRVSETTDVISCKFFLPIFISFIPCSRRRTTLNIEMRKAFMRFQMSRFSFRYVTRPGKVTMRSFDGHVSFLLIHLQEFVSSLCCCRCVAAIVCSSCGILAQREDRFAACTHAFTIERNPSTGLITMPE